MTPEQIENERAEFVTHYQPLGLDCSFDGEQFNNHETEVMYQGWAGKAKNNGWISVEDRLPEKDGDYLVYIPGYYDRNDNPIGRIRIMDFSTNLGYFPSWSIDKFVTH